MYKLLTLGDSRAHVLEAMCAIEVHEFAMTISEIIRYRRGIRAVPVDRPNN